MKTTFDCVVIGGGFTGLSAAHRLARDGKSVLLLEKDAELGGLAGGFTVGSTELEKFYHHWFTNDSYVTDLAKEIGKSDRVITRDSKTGMYFAGSFFKLSTPLDLIRFRPLSFYSRIRTGLATIWLRRIKNWKRLEQYTAEDWLQRVFGREAYSVLWEPLLRGKFGSYADKVSAVWFWKKLALRGSSRSKGGAEQLAYYQGGFAQLARDVGASIEAQGGMIKLGRGVDSVKRIGGMIEVATQDEVFRSKTAIITTALPLAAAMLDRSTDNAYRQKLRSIDYLANVCLILVLDRSLSDIYWLNINDPDFPFVGIIEHTNFEPSESYAGHHIVYLSRYLDQADQMYSMTTNELVTFSLPYIKRMFPDFEQSWIIEAHSWNADFAQPIAEKFFSDMIPESKTPLEGVYLSSMAQIYPEDRGTNYAVREGWKVADLAKIDLAES